ncbi:uncharacterized protein CTRU02_206568 [Colletotrichum truncatum]|uniref:Uncharacterized protein n=1 Tax=Colletotrichum truncatum TaxID=5467 RepID=A0ACC3Z773_COLTU|nr:uncharacterized protein CTRU02_11937 [Colletotrichum truncatum]KAF6785312.1 hypothetical protein CTRU02_11937 [Colletotrichum truncatum]
MKFSITAMAMAIPSTMACLTFSGYTIGDNLRSAWIVDDGRAVCDAVWGVGNTGNSWLVTCQPGYALEFRKDGRWVGYDTPHGRFTWNQDVNGPSSGFSWNIRMFC